MTYDTYIGSETLPPEGYLQPKRYRIVCLCGRCEQEYSWIATSVTRKDRPCPRKACKAAELQEQIVKAAANMARIIETGEPPGHIGANVVVKAIDTTAEIVMKDYNLTDLKDNVRPGEGVAPKLPPQMQHAADHMFDGGAVKGRANIRSERQAQMLGRRAIAGAFRGMAVQPGQVFQGNQGDSALRLVGSEKLRDK